MTHHGWTSGGKDELHVGRLHERLGERDGRLLDPLNEARGRAGLLGGVADDAGSLGGALHSAGMRR